MTGQRSPDRSRVQVPGGGCRHPSKLKAIVQTDKKTDRIDAKELSRLVWLSSVLESYVPTDEIRECGALSDHCNF